MRSSRPAILLAACLVSGVAPAIGAPHGPFFHYWGDVVVATDATPEWKKITPPTPEHPVYYKGASLGCKLGFVSGDFLPDVEQVNRFVGAVLAKQGYLGVQDGKHEPTLLLVLQWGTLQPEFDDLTWFLGYNPDNDIAAPTAINMLGAEVFRRDFRSREIETIIDYANGPLYGIIVTAFEFKSASTANPIPYWQTRIALPTPGKSMATALPTMIRAAGPVIGIPSNGPILEDADDLRGGHVELGDIEVVGVVPDHESESKDRANKQ